MIVRCWLPLVAASALLTPMAAVAAASEPEPPTTRQLSCQFNGGGWRSTRVVDYGFAIEVDQPSGETATYHFAVDTSPPRGGRAVDNFGESWLIAKVPTPYSLDFSQGTGRQTIQCKS